jgi:tetratricopeptide (TPR) repeat protein
MSDPQNVGATDPASKDSAPLRRRSKESTPSRRSKLVAGDPSIGDTPSELRPFDLQMLLGFLFGLIFVSVLLLIAYVTPSPTDFQIFVYRTIMALAAAGIGAIIPGFLFVQISNYVRAGGAIACFVIVYLINPPSLASQQLRSQTYFDMMERGKAALDLKNYESAKIFYSAAAEAAPSAYLPFLRLGNSFYQNGMFETAVDFYNKAFERSNQDFSILFGVALSYEGMDNLLKSLESYETIATKVSALSSLHHDAIFSIGQIKLRMWQKDLTNFSLYDESVRSFNRFLELRGEPTHWAHYHLACLFATRNGIDQKSDENKPSTFRELEATELQKFLQELKSWKSPKAVEHKALLADLLKKEEPDFWPPGNPVLCPPLRSLAVRLASSLPN